MEADETRAANEIMARRAALMAGTAAQAREWFERHRGDTPGPIKPLRLVLRDFDLLGLSDITVYMVGTWLDNHEITEEAMQAAEARGVRFVNAPEPAPSGRETPAADA